MDEEAKGDGLEGLLSEDEGCGENKEEGQSQPRVDSMKTEAEKPMRMQLITMLEPLEGRQSGGVVRALERVWSSYGCFLGIPAPLPLGPG